MKSPYQTLKKLLRTEKGMLFSETQNKYLFEVDVNANKIEIRKAVEEIYKVKVKKVSTLLAPRKPKLVRRNPGTTAERKKAFVQLAKDNKIDLTV